MQIPVSTNLPQPLSLRESVRRESAVQQGDSVGERSENTSNAIVEDREQQQGELLQRVEFAGVLNDAGAPTESLTDRGRISQRQQDVFADIPPRNRPALNTYLGIQGFLEGHPAGVELVGIDIFV